MKIFGLQFDIAWENKTVNFARARRLAVEAGAPTGSLLVLPEMFATGFTMNPQMAEEYGGPTEQFLSALAQETNCWIVGGAAMRGRDGHPRNKSLIFSPQGELAAFYAKMRPFSPGGESAHYMAGDRVCVFDWGNCVTAPFVCYDLRFPELFRKAALERQPHLYIVIANWPTPRLAHWTCLLQARAIENQAYVIGVNRMGADPKAQYSGGSMIAGPRGQILAQAGDAEAVISADLDLEALGNYRRTLPFLADLR